FGEEIDAIGDYDNDGVVDLLVGAAGDDTAEFDAGAAHILFMETNGTVKSSRKITPSGEGGPALDAGDLFGQGLTGLGDLNGDGIVDVAIGARDDDDGGINRGAIYILNLADPGSFDFTGRYEAEVLTAGDLIAWGRLEVNQLVPEGSSIEWSLLNASGSSVLFGPSSVTEGFVDISSISAAETQLVLRVDLSTTDPNIIPCFSGWRVTYTISGLPSMTFRVRVDDPVPAGQMTVDNTVTIATTTPEIDDTNNNDADSITIRLTDVQVTKSVDQGAALEGDNLVYTIDYRVNGPQDAVNVVLTDVLPVGLSYTPNSATPSETILTGAGTNGNPFILRWALGDLSVGSSGSISIPVSIDPGTAGQSLFNVAAVDNDRQDTNTDNDNDSAITFVGTLPNLYIRKTGPGVVNLGESNTYTLVYGNDGNTNAAPFSVVDTLPAGLQFVSATPSPSVSGDPVYTWTFPNLNPGETGTISVVFETTTNVTFLGTSLVNTAVISTPTGEVSLADNFDDHETAVALTELALISGFVWQDDNSNVVVDAVEEGMEDIAVVLTGIDLFGNPVCLTNRTDGDGQFAFAGILPGTYQLDETQPDGFVSTGSEAGEVNGVETGTNTTPNQIVDITLDAGDTGVAYRFGNALAAIGDFVWFDLNTNGVQDGSGEDGVPNVTVRLFDGDTNQVA
ncbi:MAG: SdrD B-like domain-containing protein, partial [Verrucomicrobiota bacterium]